MSKREIKCRALDFSGNWVYGAYIYDSVHKKHFIISCAMHGLTERSVRPETVGQFTGLLDESGVEIYEDDIVSYSVSNGIHPRYGDKASVEFRDGRFTPSIADNQETGDSFLDYTLSDFEVIGNIHENPALLNGATV